MGMLSKTLSLILFVSLLSACQVEIADEDIFANAGSDQEVTRNSNVILDASESYHENGNNLNFQWILISSPAGTDVELINASTPIASFHAAASGSYRFKVIVNHGNRSNSDEIDIFVLNTAPVANAGEDQAALNNQEILLDGSGSIDADQDPLTYQWAFIDKPFSSDANLINSDTATASFSTQDLGDYILSLTVSDGIDESTDYIKVVVQIGGNSAPSILGVNNQMVARNDIVNLDASSSTDSDNDELSFVWHLQSKPEGADSIELSAFENAATQFTPTVSGDYMVVLDVSDGEATTTKQVTISVVNAAPIINGISNESVNRNDTVILDASSSSDTNNDELNFVWHLQSKPVGADGIVLSAFENAATQFTPTVSGDYIVVLDVSDGEATSSKTVTITVNNSQPVIEVETQHTISVGNSLSISTASSYDPENDAIAFDWILHSKPDASQLAINSTGIELKDIIFDLAGDYSIILIAHDGELQSSAEISITVVNPSIYQNDFSNLEQDEIIFVDNGSSIVQIADQALTLSPGSGSQNSGHAAFNLTELFAQYNGRLSSINGSLSIAFTVENFDLDVCGACNNSFSVGLSNNANSSSTTSYAYSLNGGGFVGDRMAFSETAMMGSTFGSINNELFETENGLSVSPMIGAFRIEYNSFSSIWTIYFEQSSEKPDAKAITNKIAEFTNSTFTYNALPYLFFSSKSGLKAKFDDIHIKLDQALSDKDSYAYKLEINEHFEITRSGALGNQGSLVIEKDDNIILQRNMASELTYEYFNNSAGSYRAWLSDNGNQVSNIVTYEIPEHYSYNLLLSNDFTVSYSGDFDSNVFWTIETDRKKINRVTIINRDTFRHSENEIGSYYRIWLEKLIDGQYKRVSSSIKYNLTPDYHLALSNQALLVKSDSMITDSLSWVVKAHASLPRAISNAENTSSFTYQYNNSYKGREVKVWLADRNNINNVRSNIIHYTVENALDYDLTLADDLTISRTGRIGESLQWKVIKNGRHVLSRSASNELSYQYYANTTAANIEVYLIRYNGSYYERVSNIVKYSGH